MVNDRNNLCMLLFALAVGHRNVVNDRNDLSGFEHKASFRFVPGCAFRAGLSPHNSSVAIPDGWYYDVDTDADAECYTCF